MKTMELKKEKLGKYVQQIRGVSFKPKDISDKVLEGYVPIIKANNITESGFDNENLIYISKSKVKEVQFIQRGDIVLAASSGSKKVIGKNIIFDQEYEGSFGAFCKLVRPQKNLYYDYLKHFFKTTYFRTNIQNAVQGANINNLRNEHIDNLLIPLPQEFEDQIRVATLLSRAEELIAKRKESIRLLDELLKSTFWEMFGDPVRNEKKWNKKSLGEILPGEFGKKYGTFW